MPEIDPTKTKIVIEIDEDKPKRGEELPDNLGLLPNTVPRYPVFYRRKSFLSQDYIKFWDLGQFLNNEEVWQDLDFIAYPSASFTVDLSSPSWFVEILTITLSRFTSADWAAFFARLFTVPVTQWKSYYRAVPFEVYPPYSPSFRSKTGAMQTITPALASNNIDVFGIRWDAGKGLAYKDITAIDITSTANYSFRTNLPATYKITRDPNPSADAVTFELGGEVNVFLVPRIGLELTTCQKTVTDTPGGVTHQIITDESLNYFYRASPRVFFPTFRDRTITAINQPVDINGYFTDYVNFMRSQTGARANRIVRELFLPPGGGDHSTVLSNAPSPPGEFPPKDAYFTRYLLRRVQDLVFFRTVEPLGFESDFNFNFFNPPATPPLQAVLEKGGAIYYVWHVGSNFIASVGGAFGTGGAFRFNYKDTI